MGKYVSIGTKLKLAIWKSMEKTRLQYRIL
jgi:hypothetical protein